jgi:hypothetical protein
MVSTVGLVGLVVVLAVHTALSAVTTRYFRVRMKTTWGRAVYAATFVPLLLVVSTLVLTGPVGLGESLGGPTAAVTVVVLVPMVLGYSIDLFWMPAPEEVDLPAREEDGTGG